MAPRLWLRAHMGSHASEEKTARGLPFDTGSMPKNAVCWRTIGLPASDPWVNASSQPVAGWKVLEMGAQRFGRVATSIVSQTGV